MSDAKTQRAEFTNDIERRITDLMTEFQDLELKQMRKGEVEARARLASVKKLVDEKRGNAKRSLASAQRASSAAWDEAKAGLESAWTELRDAVQRAHAELSGEPAETEAV
jgi:hypothetical protein